MCTRIVRAHLTLNQIDVLVLRIGVRADELAVELGPRGVDAARSRSDDLLALGQIEVWRRKDLTAGQSDDKQNTGENRR